SHLEPDILIVDEVLAVGDAEFQRKCLGKMGDVAAGGRTVLFVSHNMGAVNRLCQTGLLLEDGKVKARGPVHDITAQYLRAGGSSPFEREWDDPAAAPGDAMARLRSVRASQDGVGRDAMDIRHEIAIEMEYWSFEDDAHLLPVFSVFDDQGVCLFVTAELDSSRLQVGQPKGLHRCVCHIPGNLLSEGTVRIVAEVSTGHPTYESHILERDVVSFQVVDRNEPGSVRAGWGRPLLGVVRPRCDWEFEYRGGEQA
ncbi:MAG: ABC transporter ATP-binding protein, partial [Coriobacteriia bacterium]